MGSHKGYGFAMMAELLTAITSGGLTSNHHRKRVEGKGSGTCHAFIVIDPAIFGDPQEMKDHLSTLLRELREAQRANPDVPIYTHGEKEILSYEDKKKNGLELNVTTVAEMVEICNLLGMDSVEYLGDVDVSEAKLFSYEKKK